VTPNRYATDITVNPNNSAEVFVTFGGFGSGHVFKSVNAGINWQNISGNLPDVPHHSVIIDPLFNQNIYAGSDLGVYVSTNSGVSWNEYMTGMPYALTFDLSIVYPNRKIRATTYGNGVYERKLFENPVSVNSVNSNVVNNFKLYQNYPNPFNPGTKINYVLRVTNYVSILVYDVLGNEVKSLINQQQIAGNYEVEFDGSNLASGVYFYKLQSGSFSETKRMLLIK
ncbi:MAG: T9SS type A sorting domain-containing protein, partial [Ignavibacteria bacterium]|nr:T9SS type A sorting domain-containing protein [Ignavibacteria bacterium]